MDATTVRSAGHPSFGDSSSCAVDLWFGLVSGAYRIVDWYDRGGRRYVIAARRASATGSKGLTERQKRALSLRASGQALKVIAAELGVSLSTAARDLEQALEFVGLDSEADLAAVLGAFVRTGMLETVAAHG
jgi:DNA-binding CsgD family transcriptional regulator